MRRFFLLLSTIFFLYASWTVIEKKSVGTEYEEAIETIKMEMDGIKDNPNIQNTLDSILGSILQVFGELNQVIEKEQSTPNPVQEVDPPNLEPSTTQLFSIYNIALGDTRETVEDITGQAKRTSYNEYGTEWYTYHDQYQHFMMVAYDEDNKVVGMYTNHDLIASSTGLKLESKKEEVRSILGEPMKYISKGLVNYQFPEDRGYDMFELDNSFVTIFYDQHENNRVTSIQLIDKKLENGKKDFYTTPSDPLKEGLEVQLFDLTNATRVEKGLHPLEWDDQVKVTARNHSIDMAENNYFDHTNLKGESPFDRMLEDGIKYSLAGENLASGQFSSIFAHEGLMNSLGHRENILHPEFELLGVGVAFNDKANPYYTENFYTK
ncbi:CAP domain-containing protein [Litchfieldia alkalitelluris]|uniref:CAP domain-containing protein n=1 Tax=Litchfieldia alkalitelluris TaxID=304268 RepID=UPI00099823FC|nr:CAP domain-containing protein [Litchfieldia alkalitelluris]